MPTTMVLFEEVLTTLNENWLHLPIGYHSRSSSVVLSGTPVRRAWGQKNKLNQKIRYLQNARKWTMRFSLDFSLEENLMN